MRGYAGPMQGEGSEKPLRELKEGYSESRLPFGGKKKKKEASIGPMQQSKNCKLFNGLKIGRALPLWATRTSF